LDYFNNVFTNFAAPADEMTSQPMEEWDSSQTQI